MQRIHQAAALCFTVFSASIVWESRNLEYYTPLGPGAGFFPLWLGVFMGGLSLIWLVQVSGRKGRPKEGLFLPERGGVARLLSVLAAMLAATLLMDFLGFQLAMFLLLFFLLLIPGRQTIRMTLVVALLGSVGVYHRGPYAVADVVEAIASHRPYRPGLGINAALDEIEKNRETIYDKTVADACLRLFREEGFKLREV